MLYKMKLRIKIERVPLYHQDQEWKVSFFDDEVEEQYKRHYCRDWPHVIKVLEAYGMAKNICE